MHSTAVIWFVVSIASVSSSQLINLGTATNFGLLGGSIIAPIVRPSLAFSNIGVAPMGVPANVAIGPAVISFGLKHYGDAVFLAAEKDLQSAINQAAALQCTADLSGKDLGGMTLTPGVYCFSGAATLSGKLTLDSSANPNGEFVFKIAGTFTVNPNSWVQATKHCTVSWFAGDVVTINGPPSPQGPFVGNVITANSAIKVGNGINGQQVTFQGGMYSLTGPITLSGLFSSFGSNCGAGPIPGLQPTIPTTSVIPPSPTLTPCPAACKPTTSTVTHTHTKTVTVS